MTWRPARALLVLRDEIDTAAPGRSTISDGMLGDAAHSSRTSDHNPNPAGVVRAIDVTHDVAGGCDCRTLARELAGMLGRHPALGSGAYLIFAGRIISANRLAEGWRPYTGPNPHTGHLHVSVATEAAGYDNTHPFGVLDREDDDMAYLDWPEADRKALAKDVAAALLAATVPSATTTHPSGTRKVSGMLTSIERLAARAAAGD